MLTDSLLPLLVRITLVCGAIRNSQEDDSTQLGILCLDLQNYVCLGNLGSM